MLPVYNEERRLAHLFGALIPVAESLGRSFEVVCVDDGSRDRSLEMLRDAALRDPRLRIERLPENRGKGAAVRHGMLAARGELLIFMDVDLSTELSATVPVLAALEDGCPIVFGQRHSDASHITRHQPRMREFLGRVFRWGSNRLLASEDYDFTCGFKGFRADAARQVFTRSRIDRWAFDVELVVIARALGLRIGQVPVVWQHFEGSKVRLGSAVVSSFRDLLRILGNRASGRYR